MRDDLHPHIESHMSTGQYLTKTDRFFEVSGNGIVFVNSIGSIIQRELKRDEQWTVRPDHFVASNCRLTTRSTIASKSIYIFEGPGILILQVQLRISLIERFLFDYSRVKVDRL